MGDSLYDKIKEARAIIHAYDPRLKAECYFAKPWRKGIRLSSRKVFQTALFFLENAEVYLAVPDDRSALYCYAEARGQLQTLGYMLEEEPAHVDEPPSLERAALVCNIVDLEPRLKRRLHTPRLLVVGDSTVVAFHLRA